MAKRDEGLDELVDRLLEGRKPEKLVGAGGLNATALLVAVQWDGTLAALSISDEAWAIVLVIVGAAAAVFTLTALRSGFYLTEQFRGGSTSVRTLPMPSPPP